MFSWESFSVVCSSGCPCFQQPMTPPCWTSAGEVPAPGETRDKDLMFSKCTELFSYIQLGYSARLFSPKLTKIGWNISANPFPRNWLQLYQTIPSTSFNQWMPSQDQPIISVPRTRLLQGLLILQDDLLGQSGGDRLHLCKWSHNTKAPEVFEKTWMNGFKEKGAPSMFEFSRQRICNLASRTRWRNSDPCVIGSIILTWRPTKKWEAANQTASRLLQTVPAWFMLLSGNVAPHPPPVWTSGRQTPPGLKELKPKQHPTNRLCRILPHPWASTTYRWDYNCPAYQGVD